jgi:hypothetical protein
MSQLTNDESATDCSPSPDAPGRVRGDHQPQLPFLLGIIQAGCLLTEFEVARITGLSVLTLRQWRIRKCGIRWYKLRRAVRYSPLDVAAFIEAGRRTLP